MISQLFIALLIAFAAFSAALVQTGEDVSVAGKSSVEDIVSLDKSKGWTSIACSADGQYVYAAGTNTYIYSSDNFGNDWTEAYVFIQTFLSLATSASGAIVYAGTDYGYIYKSYDYGANWQSISPEDVNRIYALASASSGQSVVAGTDKGVYVSANSGASFAQMKCATDFYTVTITSVAISSDGTYVAAAGGGNIYVSNGLDNFNQVYSSSFSFSGLSLSETGAVVRAVAEVNSFNEGFLLESVEYGKNTTWKIVNDRDLDFRAVVTASSTGTTYTAVYNGTISQLIDGKLESLTSSPGSWNALAATSSGKYIYATQNKGYIHRLKLSV